MRCWSLDPLGDRQLAVAAGTYRRVVRPDGRADRAIGAAVLAGYPAGADLFRAASLAPGGGQSAPIQHILLPAVTLGLYPMARIAPARCGISLQDALRQDYIVTARSKGLGEGAVIVRHALRNAALPLITVVGLQFGTLLGGAIVTETIFSWPGIGLLSIQAVQARDLPLVRALIAVVASMFILVNLLTDIAYAWLNPRVTLR